MSGPDAAELHEAREQLVRYSARLLADGLAVGSAGNQSVRCGDLVAITPSGIPCHELQPAGTGRSGIGRGDVPPSGQGPS